MKKRKFLVLSFWLMFSGGVGAQTLESAGTLESTVSEPGSAKRESTYSFSAQTSFGSINTGSSNVANLPDGGESSSRFTTLTPQVNFEFDNKIISSVYFAMPLYWDSSVDTSSSRSFGRPEVGVGRMLLESDALNLEIDLALKLPLYEDSSGFYVEGNRVFQIAPSVSSDVRMGKTRLHALTSARLSYDTRADVALPDLDTDVKSTALERPLALRTTFGLELDESLFTLQVSLHATNWLGMVTRLALAVAS